MSRIRQGQLSSRERVRHTQPRGRSSSYTKRRWSRPSTWLLIAVGYVSISSCSTPLAPVPVPPSTSTALASPTHDHPAGTSPSYYSPPQTETPALLDSGSVITDADGYTYRYSVTLLNVGPAVKDVTHDPPGYASMTFPVTFTATVTNTSPGGRSAPGQYLMSVWLFYTSSRPVCNPGLGLPALKMTLQKPTGSYCALVVWEGMPITDEEFINGTTRDYGLTTSDLYI